MLGDYVAGASARLRVALNLTIEVRLKTLNSRRNPVNPWIASSHSPKARCSRFSGSITQSVIVGRDLIGKCQLLTIDLYPKIEAEKHQGDAFMKYCWMSLALLLCACARAPTPLQLAEQHLWEQQLLAHVQLFKFYPANAQAQRLEGQVNAEFTIDAQGNLVWQHIISNSGSELFVLAVQASLSAASPMPAPPASVLKEGKVDARAPFIFCLDQSCAEQAIHREAIDRQR